MSSSATTTTTTSTTTTTTTTVPPTPTPAEVPKPVPAKGELDDLKVLFTNLTQNETLNVNDITNALKIPSDLLMDVKILEILSQIASFLDFNKDGKYTSDDFVLLGKELQKGNMGVYFQILTTLIGLVYSATKIRKLNVNADNVLDITIKIVLYCCLVPITQNNNVRKWATEKDTSGKTNADNLFDLIQMIYTTLKSTEEVKKATNDIINFIKGGCCCKGNTAEKADAVAQEKLDTVKISVLGILETKQKKIVAEKQRLAVGLELLKLQNCVKPAETTTTTPEPKVASDVTVI